MRRLLPLLLPCLLAACSSGPQSCQLAQVADLPVTFIDGLPTVTLTLKNHRFQMLIDTGASNSFLSHAAYRQLNSAYEFGSQVEMAGPNGTVTTGSTFIGTYTLGDITVQHASFIIADFSAGGTDGQPVIEGIIGEDILNKNNIALDFPHNRIALFERHGCETGTPFTGQFADVPFTLSAADEPDIKIYIDDKPLTALLDTGADRSDFSAAALQQLGINAQSVEDQHQSIGVGNRTGEVNTERFSNMTIGGETLGPISIDVQNSDLFGNVDGLVGEDYLRLHRLFINYDTRIVSLGTQMRPASN